MVPNTPRPLLVRPAAMLAASLLLCACASTTTHGIGSAGQQATVTGQVASVDTTPWTYDGSAVVTLSTADGSIDVHLPARWNLCKAPPPDDVQSLETGDRVHVTGTVGEDGGLVVCERPEHGLRKAP